MRCLTRCAALGVCLVACGALSSGCVVIEGPAEPGPRGGASRMPAGPIAAPAVSARSVNSRVVVAVRPLGVVPFDGRVLPVTSPSGVFLATQTGEPPAWDTVLATPDQTVPSRTRIEAYALDSEGPRRLELAEPIPPGALLGRSADDAGFLIERVLPTGGRIVERVSWLTGARTRLSDPGTGEAVAAHTTLLPQDPATPTDVGIVWSGSTVGETVSALASPVGELRRQAGVAYRLPTAGLRDDTVYAIEQRSGATTASHLVALRLEDRGAAGTSASVVARVPLSTTEQVFVAYQALSPMQTPLPAPPAGVQGVMPPGFLFFHPKRRRVVLLNPFTGALTNLAPGSSAAAWYPFREVSGRTRWGVFVTTRDGLVFQQLSVDPGATGSIDALPGAVVLEESYVPRLTTDADAPWILIGPNRSDPLKLDVLRMRIAESDP